MAVKVGNSWVSEAALSYAKVKADSGESATLNGLLDLLPGRELLDKHAGFFAERYE